MVANAGCEHWLESLMLCHESEMDMWPARPNHPLPVLIFHCLPPSLTLTPCMTWRELRVCACFSYMLDTHAYIFTPALSVPSWCQARPCPKAVLKTLTGRVCMLISDWLCVRVCFFLGGRGVWWCRKDTLTNQSLDFSSRQAHGDLEFSRMTVWSQDPA